MLSVLAPATQHMTLATKGQNGICAEAPRKLGFTNKTFSGACEKLTAAAAPLSLSDGPGPDDAPEPVRPWKRHQVTGRGTVCLCLCMSGAGGSVCVACVLACSRALVDAFAGIQAQVPRASVQLTRLTRPSGHVIMHPMPQAQGQMQL